jgi:hypothetical protein
MSGLRERADLEVKRMSAKNEPACNRKYVQNVNARYLAPDVDLFLFSLTVHSTLVLLTLYAAKIAVRYPSHDNRLTEWTAAET